jgi:hypothetical protein
VGHDVTDGPAQRAARLLRWYPRAWRARYGEEFTELLIADITERPRSWARAADVMRGGMTARIAGAGLGGYPLADGTDQVSASLVSLACCTAVFLGLGAAIWSQLTIGWQWSAPQARATTVAMVMLSAAMLAFTVLAAAAALPVAWCVAVRLARGHAKRLAAPLLLTAAGAVVMFVGARHFGNGWPGTGGHAWARQGLVPGGIAAFCWAATLSVSAYWAHPAALAAFPVAEFAWMAVSPVAMACVAGGTATAIRRAGLPASVLRYEVRLGVAACATMVVFLSGCCAWLIDGGPGPRNLFHAGAIDIVAAAAMAVAFAIAHQAVRQALRSGLTPVAR